MAEIEQVIRILANSIVFQGLSPVDISLFLKKGEKKHFRPKMLLFESGAPSSYMLILLAGKMSVICKQKVLSIIEPISIIGEMGVLLNEPRTAGIFAEEESYCLLLHKKDLTDLFNSRPDLESIILNNLLKALSNKLEQSNLQIIQLISENNQLIEDVESKRQIVMLLKNNDDTSSATELEKEHLEENEREENELEENELEENEQEEEINWAEKREFNRIDINTENSFVLIDTFMEKCSLQDVSLGGFGVFLPGNTFVNPKERICGKILLEGTTPIEFVAVVRWVAGKVIGCEFWRIAPQDKTRLGTFIERNIEKTVNGEAEDV